MQASPSSIPVKLTRRQQEVLDCLLSGLSTKEIAQALHISPHTVHNHIKLVYRAFGVSGRGELLIRCLGTTRADKPTPAVPADCTDELESLQSILQHAPDRIAQVNQDGIILFINSTTTGYRPEQVIGTSLFDHVLPEDHAKVRKVLDAVFTEGTPQEYIVRGTGGDGLVRRYHCRLNPVPRRGGVVRAVISSRELDAT